MQSFHGWFNLGFVDGIAESDAVMLLDSRHDIFESAVKSGSQLTVASETAANQGYCGKVGKTFDLVGI